MKFFLLLLYQSVNSIKRYTAIVPNDSSSTISIWKPCNNMRGPTGTPLGGIYIKHPCIMCLAMCGKILYHILVHFVATILCRFYRHTNSPVWHERSLKRLIRLKAYNLLLCFIQIPRSMRRNSGYNFRIHIQDSASLSFLFRQVQNLPPQVQGILCWTF